MSKYLDVIPLGGVGDFGMNCAILCYQNEMVLVDAGVRFPGQNPGSNLGVGVIVPDFSFLKKQERQLQAVLLTHGHEDHAGAIPHVINEFPVPVYASPLTLGLVREKLKEHRLLDFAQLKPIQARQILELGSFRIEPLHITHSFPDSFCFAISTPAGTIIWTGDFKFDQTPVDGKLSDVARLTDYGKQGVLALFSDSTNSEIPGPSPSEFNMYNSLRTFFKKATHALIFSCFSSSIHRIQIIFDLAQEFERKVLVLGRSMITNIKIAVKLNYLSFPEDLMITTAQAAKIPRRQLSILATGSQGDPMAAMSRLATDKVQNISVQEDDFVILSSRIIPGNEKLIACMVNHFYRRGAQVYNSSSSPVHSSGHGFQDDLQSMVNLIKPQFFIPIHGDFKQLKLHAELVQNQGMPTQNIRIIENGDVLRLNKNSAKIIERVQVGQRCIDNETLKEIHKDILCDRRYLSEDGVVVVTLYFERLSGELIGKPEFISRGFVPMGTSSKLANAAQEKVVELISKISNQDKKNFKEKLQIHLKRFLRKQTGKRPVILPIVVEL